MKRLLLGSAVMMGVALVLLWVNNRDPEDPVGVMLREIPSANGRQLEVRISNRQLQPVQIISGSLRGDICWKVGTNRSENLNGTARPFHLELNRGTPYTNTVPIPENATYVSVGVDFIEVPAAFVIARQINRVLHWPAAANRVARLGESRVPNTGRTVRTGLSLEPVPGTAGESPSTPRQ